MRYADICLAEDIADPAIMFCAVVNRRTYGLVFSGRTSSSNVYSFSTATEVLSPSSVRDGKFICNVFDLK